MAKTAICLLLCAFVALAAAQGEDAETSKHGSKAAAASKHPICKGGSKRTVTVTNNIPIEGAEAYKGYASASCGPAATAYQTGGGCSVVCPEMDCSGGGCDEDRRRAGLPRPNITQDFDQVDTLTPVYSAWGTGYSPDAGTYCGVKARIPSENVRSFNGAPGYDLQAYAGNCNVTAYAVCCDATPNPEVTMGYAGYGHHNAMSHGYDTMRHAGKNKL